MIRTAFRFIKTYPLFTLACIGALVALLLTLTHHQTFGDWILIGACVIALVPLITRMIDEIRGGKYGVDILALLAITTSIILQQYWAAIAVLIMLTGGESLEVFATRRARSELRDLLKHIPQHAHVMRRNKIFDIAASDVQPRDFIVIHPGEVVPVDAIITDGTSSFDESSLTGESVPDSKDIGDTILSGAVNMEGEITAQATSTAKDSQYQQIVRLVDSAAAHPAPYARLADRYSIPFTMIALTIGGVAGILSHDPVRFLDVLVVATPCPLILAAPIALIAGMSRASREGVVIKTGTALEALAEAKTFVFDKTGTLTHGTLVVESITAFSPYTNDEVLGHAAALEQSSTHVLAQAIITAAQDRGLKLQRTKHVREIAGRGLEAHVHGSNVLVGRLSLMKDQNVSLPPSFDPSLIAQSASFVAIGDKLAGYITFSDELREDAPETLNYLRVMGVKQFVMVTGDNQTIAQSIASRLGIQEVVAETLPADKILAVERLSNRPVAFVGDGVNDAPVLMAADVGIALGARGSTAASESADIVILKDNIGYVARAVAVARRSFRIANEGIAIGISLSVILMFIFATGRFSPILGAIIQEIVDVIVILNALRAHGTSHLPKLP
jgi:heavy metal translocating P-type ATPase